MSVIICSADKNIVGEFYLASSNGVFALGTNIDVKLLKDPYTKVDSPSDSKMPVYNLHYHDIVSLRE